MAEAVEVAAAREYHPAKCDRERHAHGDDRFHRRTGKILESQDRKTE
jgi:hypothetical protein